jgi:hypothetical protein
MRHLRQNIELIFWRRSARRELACRPRGALVGGFAGEFQPGVFGACGIIGQDWIPDRRHDDQLTVVIYPPPGDAPRKP